MATIKLKKKVIYSGIITLKTGLHIGGTNAALNIGGPDKFVVRNPINNVNAVTASSFHCLEEDLTGENSLNYIQSEIHYVDVPNNRFVIRPQCGSFYKHGLTLVFQGDGSTTSTPLVENVDYVVTGINEEKTAISDPTSGVYEYIVLKKSYTGKVLVTYHAFGGEVTQADINTLKNLVQNVYVTVTSKELVTLTNLSSTSIIRELIYRQELLEHTIGHFQSQRFIYTTGATEKWVNVAFVGTDPWTANAGVPTSGIGEFRVKVPDMDFFMDIKINYDLDAAETMNISVYHADIPTFDKNKFNYFIKRVLPKFRLIWCTNVQKGLMLQMSMTSSNITRFTVIVDDMTGAKSPWTLVDTVGEERPGTDNTTVEYYTNTAVNYGVYNSATQEYSFDWKSANGNSSNIIPLYPSGYTVFVGSIPVTSIEEETTIYTDAEFGDTPTDKVNGGYTVEPIITGSDIDLAKVKAVEFKLFDRYTEKFIISRSQRLNCKNNVLLADTLYFVDDLCSVSCSLEHNNGYIMKLFSRTGTNSLNNDRFNLVQIDLIG